MMFKGKTHNPSNFSTVPEGPNLWKVHLVILGKTRDMGSSRSSGGSSLMANKSLPYWLNSPIRNQVGNGNNGLGLHIICRSKLTAKKKIHEIDLRKYINQIEYFANKKLDSIHSMHVPIVDEVVDHEAYFLFFSLRINDGLMQVLY